jgi:dihydroorotate dehydrogenase
MNSIYLLLRPALLALPPERAHALTLRVLQSGLLRSHMSYDHPALNVTLWDRKFPNPLGLAAGFDKNAQVVGGAFALGFGFVEAGTVTPKPQAGNPKPRIVRDKDAEAVINRMGFPNAGLDAFRANLARFLDARPRPPGLLGINIGMNKDQVEPARDYCQLIQQLGPMADYITVNISSPNTPGLRDLQRKEAFLDLTGRILEERARSCGSHPSPVLVKLSPDLTEEQQEELAEAALASGIDGLILANTTLDRPSHLTQDFASQRGGLSGRPLKEKATATIRTFYRLTGGRLPIIGVGGVASAADAYEKIRAGASLVQLYTALVFQGPGLVGAINTGLLELLKKDGLSHISQAVGLDKSL